jgi:hypothetical protein
MKIYVDGFKFLKKSSNFAMINISSEELDKKANRFHKIQTP